jgi:hypothetical protein
MNEWAKCFLRTELLSYIQISLCCFLCSSFIYIESFLFVFGVWNNCISSTVFCINYLFFCACLVEFGLWVIGLICNFSLYIHLNAKRIVCNLVVHDGSEHTKSSSFLLFLLQYSTHSCITNAILFSVSCALDAEILKYVAEAYPKGICSVYCVKGKDVEGPGSNFELVVVISAVRNSPQNFWCVEFLSLFGFYWMLHLGHVYDVPSLACSCTYQVTSKQ